ncbi:MAG: hypothetical protein ACREPL_15370 [Rhodanobacteraceae bacterium]
MLSGCATTRPFELQSLETKDLRLLYTPQEAYLAPYAAQSYENSLAFQERTFHYTPWDPRTTVVLADLSDDGNGGTSVSPRNGVSVYIAPDSDDLGTDPGTDRMFTTFNHEVVHVATLDGWNQRDKRWRDFFGGKPEFTNQHPATILYNYLTVPRTSSPRWYREGIAVFMETWMSGGIGRAQGAYDEMVWRAMVRDNAHFATPLGLVSKVTAVNFQNMTQAYLYGTRFVTYLALQYSPQKVIEWYSRENHSKAYYADAFRQVFHLPLDQAWNNWIAFEHKFQRANLRKVREFPLTKLVPLTSRALGSVSRCYLDPRDDALIGAFMYPGALPFVGVVELSNGSVRQLAEIHGAMAYTVAYTAWDPASQTLFYTEKNYGHRDLKEINVRTGRSRMLLKGARIGDLAFDRADRSVWGVRQDDGYSTLVRIPYPYKDWHQVHTFAYGKVPSSLSVSPDGTLLSATVAQIDGHRYLRVFRITDLLAGKVKPVAQYDFGQAAPEDFAFSADGRYLYGSSYYTGISNIYRYDLATGKMDAVSNVATGLFRPMPMPDGKLAALEYTGHGLLPVEFNPVPLQNLGAITFMGTVLADKYALVRSWGVGSPSKVPLQSMITHQGTYDFSHHIRPEDRYPVIEGYRGDVALGWHVDFADPLNLHSIGVTAAVSTGAESVGGQQLHFGIDYKGLNWYAQYWHNLADFYDLFGPVKNSRKGNAWTVGYKRSLIYDLPRSLDLDVSASYYSGLNTLPQFQNVSTVVSDIFVTQAGLDYSNKRKSEGAVDFEKGVAWNLDAATFVAGGHTISQLRGGFAFGFPLLVPHMSFWMYNSAGWSSGNRSNVLANFYFGAFQNNYIDYQSSQRYREYDSFPGFEIDELAGHSFAKTTLELNLPPLRFAQVGSPGFYLSWLRPAVFTGVLVTDPNQAAYRRTSRDVGAQLDLRFVALNQLPMTLSAGYARGFGGSGIGYGEWMLSLRILK